MAEMNRMNDAYPAILSVTDGGVTAEHSALPVPQNLVAPTHSGQEHNTIKPALIPFACWRANDMRFEFDSSFVLPGIRTEMGALKWLIDKHTLPNDQGAKLLPALTVFGHADPTGNDDYNKSLSGRRAAAVYAVLTRRDDIWEDLFKESGKFAQPAKGDQWGLKSIQIMLTACDSSPGRSDGQMDGPTKNAIMQFQTANSLNPDGDPGPQTRKKLFLAYMEKICVKTLIKLNAASIAALRQQTVPEPILIKLSPLLERTFATEDDFIEELSIALSSDEQAQHQAAILEKAKSYIPYTLPADHFLGSGRDKLGKADYQGCGEFNPVILQSQQDIDKFEKTPDSSPDKPGLKAARDASNQLDRRVLIFLFRPGLLIDPSVWPCPRAKEGSAGCKKRFFSDGDIRRNTRLPDKERKFKESRDTFACRFYNRLSANSPCEGALQALLNLRILDGKGDPRASLPYKLEVDDRTIEYVTDKEGFIKEVIYFDSDMAKLTFDNTTVNLILKGLAPSNTILGTQQRLANLGFLREKPGTETTAAAQQATIEFQASESLPTTGDLEPKTIAALVRVHGS